MSVIAGKSASLFATGTALSFTTEATTASGNISYQITDTVKRVWDRTATISVFDGGVPTVESYTVNRLNGTITFTGAVARVITVTGSYLPLTEMAQAKDCSYTISANNEDISAFGVEYIVRKQALLDFSVSLTQLYVDETYTEYLTTGAPIVLEISSNSSSTFDVRAWVLPSSDDVSSSVDGIVEEGMEFEGTTDSDLRCLTLT